MITESEIIIMKVIWSKNPISSREIIKTVNIAKDWKPTTVRTLINRLVEKKKVNVKKIGNKNLYYPNISQKEVYESIFDDAVYHICNKSVGDMITYLISSNDLSSKDILNIENALKSKTPNDNIKCNCIEKFGVCNCEDCSSK